MFKHLPMRSSVPASDFARPIVRKHEGTLRSQAAARAALTPASTERTRLFTYALYSPPPPPLTPPVPAGGRRSLSGGSAHEGGLARMAQWVAGGGKVAGGVLAKGPMWWRVKGLVAKGGSER